MKDLLTYCIILMALVLGSLQLSAQRYWDVDDHPLSLNMPQISLVTIMPNNSAITLELGTPVSPGEKPRDNVSEAKDSSKWLNYTSCRRGKKTRRRVDVQITQGAIPDGLKISVKASKYKLHGKGRRGNPSRTIYLSTASQTLVNNIGNCHTGRGAQRGHRLTYQLILDDFNKLNAEPETSITVTYTISDL